MKGKPKVGWRSPLEARISITKHPLVIIPDTYEIKTIEPEPERIPTPPKTIPIIVKEEKLEFMPHMYHKR